MNKNMRQISLKRNALLNMTRRGSAILFPIISFSYASHKLGASGMGAFSFCNSVVSYFLLFAALGIATYAVREGQEVRDDIGKLTKFVSEVYTINILTTIMSYAALFVLIVVWSKLSAYQEIVLLLSVAIVMTTIGADWVNTLLEDYLYITLRYIGIQVFCLVMLVLLVKEPKDVYLYALISALSAVGGNVLNVWYIRRKIHFRIVRHPNIKKHIKPMLTLFSSDISIKIYLIADITILGILMADAYVGYYTVASRVYTAVKELINALIIVSVPRFSYYISHKQLDNFSNSFRNVCDGVATLMIPSIVGLIFQAENIVYFLGGKEYVEGTRSLQILAFAIIFAVGACLVSQSVLIPNKMEKHYMRATIVAAVLNIVLNFIMIPVIGIEAAAITTFISEMVVFIMMFYNGRFIIPKFKFRGSDVGSALVGSLGVGVICVIFSGLIQGRFLNMVLSIVVSIIVYAVIVVLMKNHTAANLLAGLKNRIS